jgi:twitching motility two-component system response regulator PilH
MPLRGVKILVVEDHRDSRELVRKMLEYRGALVTEAADGDEALRRVAEDCPDLILCDLMMPRMDGYEVPSECVVCQAARISDSLP